MADQNIANLPVKTSSAMGDADHFLVIDSADGHLITGPELAKYIFNEMLSSKIQSGTTSSAVSVASKSYADFSVTFPIAFASVPNVVVTLKGSANNSYRGECYATVTTVSKTAFTARIFNASDAAISFTASWIAMV